MDNRITFLRDFLQYSIEEVQWFPVFNRNRTSVITAVKSFIESRGDSKEVLSKKAKILCKSFVFEMFATGNGKERHLGG